MKKGGDRPSQHGAILGQALADIAKAGRSGHPDFPDMCATCAFREGTLPNRMGGTGKIALDCLLGIAGDGFACHHGMKEGAPTKICAGYLAAQLAPYPVVMAAVSTVSARLKTLPPEDAALADFKAWIAEVDPTGEMDVYQQARAFARR